LKISSPDKLLFPSDGVTKLDVVRHYEAVGDKMMELAYGRPLTLQRFPRGIEAKGFMQKNTPGHYPDSIRRLVVPKRGGGETVYPVVTDADDIAYLANQNTITFHMWTSSADRPGQPDWMVIDLDPEDGDIDGVRAATLLIREVLGEFAVDSFPVATGSKGFHVWIPLAGGHDFGAVSETSRAIAGLAVLRAPHGLTTEFLKRERKGRVFVDWLRNGPTATVVVPFSLRPRARASVAVPLTWDEVPHATPSGCTIGDLGSRLSLDLAVKPQTLPTVDVVAAARAAGVDLDTPHDRFGRR